VHSALDDIPGIGEKRRKALLKTFRSVENLGKASVDDIAQVEGMNRRVAELVFKRLQGEKASG